MITPIYLQTDVGITGPPLTRKQVRRNSPHISSVFDRGPSLAVGREIPIKGRGVYFHDGILRILSWRFLDAHPERIGAGTLE
jgi:hypothetical protein